MEHIREEVIPNGLGLASVNTFVKTEALVEMHTHNGRELSSNWNYNHRYTVKNLLTNSDKFFDREEDGSRYQEEAEAYYQRCVFYNKGMIDRVKAYLETQQ